MPGGVAKLFEHGVDLLSEMKGAKMNELEKLAEKVVELAGDRNAWEGSRAALSQQAEAALRLVRNQRQVGDASRGGYETLRTDRERYMDGGQDDR